MGFNVFLQCETCNGTPVEFDFESDGVLLYNWLTGHKGHAIYTFDRGEEKKQS